MCAVKTHPIDDSRYSPVTNLTHPGVTTLVGSMVHVTNLTPPGSANPTVAQREDGGDDADGRDVEAEARRRDRG